MSKVIKETRYCKVLRQAKIRDNNVAYGIEKIFVKELNQEEIRFAYFKDIIKGSIIKEEQLVARPLDLPEDDLIKLIELSIKQNVFSKEFISKLKDILNKQEEWLVTIELFVAGVTFGISIFKTVIQQRKEY